MMPARKAKKGTSPKSKKKKVGEARAKYQVRTRRVRMPKPHPIVQKRSVALKKYYGDRLKGVILYGSTARGQAGPSSDIDLLVLLSPPIGYFAELRELVDVLYPIQLESDQLISAKPASVRDFELGNILLYRNAKREGIAVQ